MKRGRGGVRKVGGVAADVPMGRHALHSVYNKVTPSIKPLMSTAKDSQPMRIDEVYGGICLNRAHPKVSEGAGNLILLGCM